MKKGFLIVTAFVLMALIVLLGQMGVGLADEDAAPLKWEISKAL
ncbi:MAG TPA: hypothetical protein VK564_04790 [Thermodesulfobacteriota bacterium]|nr:hypothetical protein [Thermodesulfobacteriota bacterium]